MLRANWLAANVASDRQFSDFAPADEISLLLEKNSLIRIWKFPVP
jgi:hypothetical protein